MPSVWRVRAGLLLLGGALLLHELRYELVRATAEPHAHSYLSWLGPLLCGALVLGTAEFAVRVLRQRRSEVRETTPRPTTRWFAFALILFAVFSVQEVAETIAVHGRLDIAEALLAHGAWIAAPLSLAIGGAIALLLGGAHALLASGRRLRAPRRRALPVSTPRSPRLGAADNPLARNLAGRAPPLSFVT